MQTCCVDLWHPKLFEKVAFPQNGHWKPELLSWRDDQSKGQNGHDAIHRWVSQDWSKTEFWSEIDLQKQSGMDLHVAS